jgi:hypothetical protein
MFHLRYVYLFAHSGVQHMLRWFSSSCVPFVCQFLWIVHFLRGPSVFSHVYERNNSLKLKQIQDEQQY